MILSNKIKKQKRLLLILLFAFTVMSVDGETSRVMKGVQHGACDYLLKPIRMKELKIIWQHVLRKKLQEVRDIEGCCYDGGADWFTQGQFLGGGEDVSFGKKRKDFDFEKKLFQDESDQSSSSKKARVVWSYELHQKFVNAVNQIGCDHSKYLPLACLLHRAVIFSGLFVYGRSWSQEDIGPHEYPMAH